MIRIIQTGVIPTPRSDNQQKRPSHGRFRTCPLPHRNTSHTAPSTHATPTPKHTHEKSTSLSLVPFVLKIARSRLERVHLAPDATTTVEDLATALGPHACTEAQRATTLGVALTAGVMHSHDCVLLSARPGFAQTNRPSFRAPTVDPHHPAVYPQPHNTKISLDNTTEFGHNPSIQPVRTHRAQTHAAPCSVFIQMNTQQPSAIRLQNTHRSTPIPSLARWELRPCSKTRIVENRCL